jgi:hypothetical protein
MSAASSFISVVGYIGLSAVTGAAAGVIVLTGIFTPLSLRYALCCAAPLGAVSALCVYKALQV